MTVIDTVLAERPIFLGNSFEVFSSRIVSATEPKPYKYFFVTVYQRGSIGFEMAHVPAANLFVALKPEIGDDRAAEIRNMMVDAVRANRNSAATSSAGNEIKNNTALLVPATLVKADEQNPFVLGRLHVAERLVDSDKIAAHELSQLFAFFTDDAFSGRLKSRIEAAGFNPLFLKSDFPVITPVGAASKLDQASLMSTRPASSTVSKFQIPGQGTGQRPQQ